MNLKIPEHKRYLAVTGDKDTRARKEPCSNWSDLAHNLSTFEV
jgi:hypothetical protein